MSWHCSQALVAEFSQRKCLDGEPCARLKSIRTAERSCFDGKKKSSYRRSLSGMTYEPLTASRGVEKWMSSVRGSRASHSVVRGSAKVKPTSETCGPKLSESFARLDRRSRCWKMFLALFPADMSVSFFEGWPRAGTMQDGIIYRRPPAAPIFLAIACGSLPRLPRPVTCDGKGSGRIRHERSQAMNLRDWWNANYNFVYPPVRVVEYLMGFPAGWTDLKPLETHKYRQWQQQHGMN